MSGTQTTKPSTVIGVAAAVLILGACTYIPGYSKIKPLVSVEAAKTADEALRNAEWVLCNASSIGSVNRRYGASKELSRAYQILCSTHGAVPLGNP